MSVTNKVCDSHVCTCASKDRSRSMKSVRLLTMSLLTMWLPSELNNRPSPAFGCAKNIYSLNRARPINWPAMGCGAALPPKKDTDKKTQTWKRNHIYGSENRKGRKGRGGGENYPTEIKDSYAAQKIWAFPLPFPDLQRLLRSAAPAYKHQIAWLNSHVALTLSDIYIPIEVFLFLKF